MTYFGAKVLHFPAVLPAIAARIPLVIRNSFAPDGPGTTISEKGDPRPGIRAVTAISGLCLLSLDGKGMSGIPGSRRASSTRRPGSASPSSCSRRPLPSRTSPSSFPSADRLRTAAALGQEFRYEKLVGAIDGVAAKSPIAVVPPSETACAGPSASRRRSSPPSRAQE